MRWMTNKLCEMRKTVAISPVALKSLCEQKEDWMVNVDEVDWISFYFCCLSVCSCMRENICSFLATGVRITVNGFRRDTGAGV